MNLRSFHEILFLLVILFLSLIGFLGPVFWKTPQLAINNKIFEKNFGNVSVNIDRLSQFYTNKNYLSSDQFNNKIIVLEWSKLILNNVKIGVPVARMYFPYIPRNISEYETNKKKLEKIFRGKGFEPDTFYGQGTPDPLRHGKEKLSNLFSLIEAHGKFYGCEIYNLSTNKSGLLKFKRVKKIIHHLPDASPKKKIDF